MAEQTEQGEQQREAAASFSRWFTMSEQEQQALAQAFGVGVSDPALPGAIATADEYGLNPYLGELWLADSDERVRDAGGRETEQVRRRVTAGRDGFLSIAHKSGVLHGVQADVVCEQDEFEVDWSVAPSEAPRIVHRHAPQGQRGSIVGAWAKVSRTDQLPYFYFAPFAEHVQTYQDAAGETQMEGAWSYMSAMSIKSAMSLALRMAFSITGIVPADEIRADEPLDGGDPFADVPWGPDAAIADRLRSAVNAANATETNRYSPATLQMMLAGQSPEELVRIAERIERENAERAEREGAARPPAGEEQPAADPDGGFDSPEGRTQSVEGDEEYAALKARHDDLTQRLDAAESGSREQEELEAERAIVAEKMEARERQLLGTDEPAEADPEQG